MRVFANIIFILSFGNLVHGFAEPDKYKLEQLQVLFRHGDRTPNKPEIFVADPHDEIYRSYGYGQLTKIGKEREYKIGQILRERYNDFLGEYGNDDVYAYSTDMDRTKMSLQLVLAGLYPPTPYTSWNDFVNWQPIPTHYDAWDTGFLSATIECPKYSKLFHNVAKVPEVSAEFQKYQSLFQRLQNKTGITISSPFTGWNIYMNFRAALSLGLPLLPGFNSEDFGKLEEITSLIFKAMTYTEQLRKMMTGPIVERLLKVLNENQSQKKIYLYGGHEFDIAAFTNALNITGTPMIPDFGSALILEKLRGPDGLIYIRLYLWTGVSEKLISLKLNNCERTCLLSDYEKIVQPVLPNAASRVCVSSNVLSCRRRMESAKEIDPDLQLSYLFAGSDLSSFKYMKDFSPYMIERS